MDNEQKEKLAKLIAEFGIAAWNHDKEEKDRLFDECMDIIFPEEKEQTT